MRKNKWIWVLVFVLFLIGVLIWRFVSVVREANATSCGKVTICHATESEGNPYVQNEPCKTADVQGHDGHEEDIIPPFSWFECPGEWWKYSSNNSSKPCKMKVLGWWKYADKEERFYLGKNWDEEGQVIWENDCQVPEEPVYHYVCRETACVKVEGEGESECQLDSDCVVEPTPTPTPELTPTPTPTLTEERPSGCQGNCSAPAPVCAFPNTVREVINFHVYRNGDTAILKWWATEGNRVNIYWKNPDSLDWQHSLQTDNFGYAEIHGLGGADWTFGVQQVSDCSGGLITVGKILEVVDGNVYGWVLFR